MKFSEEDWENKTYEQTLAMLVPEVRRKIEIKIGNLTRALLERVDICESPIEELMALGLYDSEDGYAYRDINIIEILQQQTIECGKKHTELIFKLQ